MNRGNHTRCEVMIVMYRLGRMVVITELMTIILSCWKKLQTLLWTGAILGRSDNGKVFRRNISFRNSVWSSGIEPRYPWSNSSFYFPYPKIRTWFSIASDHHISFALVEKLSMFRMLGLWSYDETGIHSVTYSLDCLHELRSTWNIQVHPRTLERRYSKNSS